MHGLIIANDGKQEKGKHQFTTTYIFNPFFDKNQNKKSAFDCKTLTLIDGFAKDYIIPSSITGLIATFYGQSKWDKTSIIAKITTSTIDYNKLKFGKQIEIMYDPKQPKVWNIPKIVLEDKEHNDGADAIMVMAPCCICTTVIIYWITVTQTQAKDYNNNVGNALLFIITLSIGSFIIAGICICCLYLSCYTTDQHKLEADNLRRADEMEDNHISVEINGEAL